MTTPEFVFYRRAELLKFFKMMFGKNRWRRGLTLASGIPDMDSYRWLQSNFEGTISLHTRYELFAYSVGFVSVLDKPVNTYLKQLKSAQQEVELDLAGLRKGVGKPAIIESKKL